MSKMSSPDKEKLYELLRERMELFVQLQEHCERQAKLLGEDKLTELDTSLNEAQKLRDKIGRLHQESKPLMQSYLSCADEDKDSRIDELAAKIEECIKYCAGLNEKNMAAIKIKTEEQKKKIDEQSAKRKTISGYAQSLPNSSEVFDKKT